jgi:transposase
MIIIYVGMDIHSSNYTLCCYTIEGEQVFYVQKMEPDYKLILKYLEWVRTQFNGNAQFICGYEAGCLGYTLYHQLTAHNVKCIILAPTTMAITTKNRIKTDKRDAGNIAKCLAYQTYSPVHIPTKEDEQVKEYIRMRDDHKLALKKIKQQILAICLRQGYHFTEGKNYWTQKHLTWLKTLKLENLLKETLNEYLLTYNQLIDKISRFDERIEKLASAEVYNENVRKLRCLIGVETHTALSVLVEVGDFKRFAKAEKFASYIGLVPGEDSSGEKQNRIGITKAGNSHVRRLLTEASQCYTRGQVGHKSKALKLRQAGNSPEIIAYADKANERLKRKFYKMLFKNAKRNIATTAIARELACFMWGMMTDHIAV